MGAQGADAGIKFRGVTMRYLVFIAAVVLAAGGCASVDTGQDERVKFQVSDKADKAIDEDGATAAMRGYDRDSELVCETWTKTGSHMKQRVCYTREERDRARQDHQDTWGDMTKGTPCAEGRDC